MLKIDAVGLSCPEPVVMLSKALKDKPSECVILVDNPAAVENCTRFGIHTGYEVAKEKDGTAWMLKLHLK